MNFGDHSDKSYIGVGVSGIATGLFKHGDAT
jgi:hypothetical protein